MGSDKGVLYSFLFGLPDLFFAYFMNFFGSSYNRIPKSVSTEPRSSRLKDKKKGEGETLIKELFVEDVMRNNDLLHILGEGSSVVLLPQNSLEEIKASESSASRNIILDRKLGVNQFASFYPVKGKLSSLPNGNRLSFLSGSDSACTLASQTHKVDAGTERTAQGDRLSDKGLFSCVTCGILSFACVAIVQPREAAAHYLMSADCSIFNDHYVGPPVPSDGCTVSAVAANPSEMNSHSGRCSLLHFLCFKFFSYATNHRPFGYVANNVKRF